MDMPSDVDSTCVHMQESIPFNPLVCNNPILIIMLCNFTHKHNTGRNHRYM